MCLPLSKTFTASKVLMTNFQPLIYPQHPDIVILHCEWLAFGKYEEEFINLRGVTTQPALTPTPLPERERG